MPPHLFYRESLMLGLPDDLLIAIFSFCDIESLGRVARTCKKLYNLTKCNSVWKRHYSNLTCIHSSCHPREFDKKSKLRYNPSLKEFCKLSLKWKSGKGNAVAIKHYNRQLPWMELDSNNYLWISDENEINAYKVNAANNIQTVPNLIFECDKHDVNRFASKRNVLVAGYRDGSVACYSKNLGRMEIHLKKVHTKEIQTVDVIDDVYFVTGSFDYTVKVFNMHSIHKEQVTLQLCDRVLSLVSLERGMLAVGTAGVKHFRSPITIWDIERALQISYVGWGFKHGAGILDMKELSSNILVTSDYDSCVKVWDLRVPSSRSILSFEDPCDSAVYCIAPDYRNSIMSGSARSSQSLLWDLRLSRRPVQVRWVLSGDHVPGWRRDRPTHFRSSSPVYSLAFGPTALFMALDECLVKIDFCK